MNLADYQKIIINSTKDDWTHITWKDGPATSLYDFTVSLTHEKITKVKWHEELISLRNDLSVAVAWGLVHQDKYYENWLENVHFSDTHVSSHYIDFFYNGQIVFRDLYLLVDGIRGLIPLPDAGTLGVPEGKYKFFDLVSWFTLHSPEYENYFKRTGLQITEDNWMTL